MEKKKRVGIMGGTFNPVHMAHLILAENAYRDQGLDEILFIPNCDPPHKVGLGTLPAAIRYEMLELAVDEIPYFTVTDMEIRRQGLSYTSDTLAQLQSENPDTEYYFIMGADSLFEIETWHEPVWIMQHCRILAAVRDGHSQDEMIRRKDELNSKYGAGIELLTIPELDLSSTEIRSRVAMGKSIRFMVPEKVCRYIEDNGLYRDQNLGNMTCYQ